MQKQHCASTEPLERHLFHRTTTGASEDICLNNFDPRLAGVSGNSYGFGSCFSISASYSHMYATKLVKDEVRYMFVAKVLVGNVTRGKSRPPALHTSSTTTQRLCVSCVDNKDDLTVFMVYDSCQCYPYYLIKYKSLPHGTDI